MKNVEIEQLTVAMREATDKRLYERFLAVRLRLEDHSSGQPPKLTEEQRHAQTDEL
ncbi:hypothetical protein [Paenibacillus nasutitermitis]|uniref:Uncharacterized protein n=1 Tax=Paenibacillus nasutitermitis TaxID=1652958 RepID=A0A916ZLT6_9BACL|nr:hypothetical protein [Paenibacillus nasutitermitis]GGE02637.1 hypothetical protein GCM10010911_72100 [Paenibacillus nasutitermitis]